MQVLNATQRECAVCGSFYSANTTQLKEQITKALHNAKAFPLQNIQALIVPHAGYVYSGHTAAIAYKTLHKKYKNVFIIGSSHHLNFNGISIYNKGDYNTPLGVVKTNKKIIQNLLENNFITYKQEAHTKEHTIEVQLPFLQTIFKEDLQIVPIIIASSELDTIHSLASVLQPYFNDENLFVISTDLSHFPAYKDAKELDMKVLNSIKSNSSKEFVDTLSKHEKLPVANLQTSACGWSSVLTLLTLTQEKNYTYELLEYTNSGDSQYGDKQRVVGYGAMRIYKEKFFLNEEEKKELKEIAKLTLYEAVIKNKRATIDTNDLNPKYKAHLGVFVTLYHKGKLKGCIGRFEPNQPLYELIQDMSIAASRHDTRFQAVKVSDLKDISIEISVLTPREKAKLEDIIIGTHGIYVQYGNKNGTYLPHVATDMHWNKEEFFKSCCEDKAGIKPQNCKKAELYTYEAIVF
jgi:AmmeMemoRadiSam system protein B/AmmeMemoRadiSam system protein A